MKSTGVIRPVDMLGRIVPPRKFRSTLSIAEKGSLEIFVEDSAIILKKYQPSCVFYGSMDRILKYKDHNVCHKCMKRLAKRLEEESD